MTVSTRDEPAGTAAGHKAVLVWGPPAEVRQWLEITDGVEWFSRPQPHASGVLVRVQMRQQLSPAAPRPFRRVVAAPWWQRRDLVVLAGLAVGVVLGGLALVAWVVVTAVTAAVTWVAAHWALIVAVLFVAILALLLLRKSGGGCAGLHCTGCKYH